VAVGPDEECGRHLDPTQHGQPPSVNCLLRGDVVDRVRERSRPFGLRLEVDEQCALSVKHAVYPGAASHRDDLAIGNASADQRVWRGVGVADIQARHRCGQLLVGSVGDEHRRELAAHRGDIVTGPEESGLGLGVGKHTSGLWMALGMVAVEQNLRSMSVHDRCKLPPQIRCVLNAKVHALGPHGRMDVRGVSRQKHSTAAILDGLATGVCERRQ